MNLWNWFSWYWCRIFHRRSFMFAGGSKYRCRTCLREFTTPWNWREAERAFRQERGTFKAKEAPSRPARIRV